MDCLSRRGLISAASLGLVGPLLVVESAEGAGRRGLIRARDVPVGGGVIIANRHKIVTQPRAGRFRVFSTTCTHEGAQLNRIDGRQIVCPRHGSRFAIGNGSVVQGPATRPLASIPFTIRRGWIVT